MTDTTAPNATDTTTAVSPAPAHSSVPLSETPHPTANRHHLPGRLDVLLRRPPARIVQLACLSALIANTLIVITGGAVRLTNSGLGCPTWPECTAGSLVPVPSLGYHGVIEFSNRLLTYAVTAAVAAAIIATMRQRPRRPALTKLSWALFFGVVAQAIIGGISVRTQLAPGWVAFHFCFSIGMIAISWLLWVRSREGDAPAQPLLRTELIWLARTLVGAAGAVVVVGTLVSGSGPHAGALDAARRLPFKPVEITQAHADLVFIVVGLTIALWFALKATDAPAATLRATRDLFLILMAQAVIGYTQYFTGLPAWLVLLHMAGACLTWIAAWRILTSMRVRPERATD
ncbi:COX15/CtaA family protein [Actinocrinis sp.]|uniref:COX15/CtaA family protein n=1 Tax=Actinocrinis sp. TaxID=1920516 RepID=UPI002D6D7486|nr:COX15/CtaA family protein [Actinocrinis sp.]HZP50172.1 COX15/CtaA family protein [Actinocrinis sp.]